MEAWETSPAGIFNLTGSSPLLLICEHASHYIPAGFERLGLEQAVARSHIGWDIGGAAVAFLLSQQLDATLMTQRYSRLLYDCNRPPSSDTAIPVLSELTKIPGNQDLDDQQRQARIDGIYEPFHCCIEDLVKDRQRAGRLTHIVTVHSFTRWFKGVERELELGVICDSDHRLTDAFLQAAMSTPLHRVQKNEPYSAADGVTHTLIRQAIAPGLHNTMLEIRNDLIDGADGQHAWAERIGGWLQTAADSLD